MDAIVYQSNAGHTERYAELLCAASGLPAYSLKAAKLPAGSQVIYMGWLMGGGISGLKKARARFDIKAVCAVGMSRDNEKQNADIKTQNALGELPYFYLQGGYESAKLRGLYAFMMKMMEKGAGKGLSEKADRTPDEDDLLDMLQNGGDRVDEKNLAGVLEWLRTQ